MYKLMTLPFPYDGLEPFISELTVNIHYNKHHRKYVDNLNKLIPSSPIPLDEIPVNIDMFPMDKRGDILFNAGGVLNHNLYWNSLSENPILPSGKLLDRINMQYGSYDNFKRTFINKAKMVVGSGYTFLVSDSGNLIIMNLPNQETPLSYGLNPIFCIDLWEHAYYLDYQNNRDQYIENFFNKASFRYANSVYE